MAIVRIGALVNSAIFPFLYNSFGLAVAVGGGGALGIPATIITMFLVKET